jgi:hypothetical protein
LICPGAACFVSPGAAVPDDAPGVLLQPARADTDINDAKATAAIFVFFINGPSFLYFVRCSDYTELFLCKTPTNSSQTPDKI